jgi:hypothetical protein
MTHSIIKTENYLLVGSNDDLRRGWFYCVRKNDIFQDEGEDVHCCMADIRIAAHLPLNNAPTLEEVPLLPPLEDEGFRYIHSLAFDEAIIQYKMNRRISILDLIPMFINGYNKAKEKYFKSIPDWVYTRLCVYDKRNPDYLPYDEDDLTKKPTNCSCDNCFYDRTKMAEFIIQSPQQPKYPLAFECEMEKDFRYNDDGEPIGFPPYETDKPKTITNSQGLTQVVGKYIY